MINQNRILTAEEIRALAPSVFADSKLKGLSKNYRQYNTGAVVDRMQAEGWMPVYAREQRVNNIDRKGYQKHVIRFRQDADIQAMNSGSKSESFDMVLSNSNDRTSCYSLSAGIFRVVCINGLVVGSEAFSMKVRHVGTTPYQVVKASFEVIKRAPGLMQKVTVMKDIILNVDQMGDLARRAYLLKFDLQPKEYIVKDVYGNEYKRETTVFSPKELLRSRRPQDDPSSLWAVFNRVQENIVKGMRYTVDTNNGYKSIRGINSINENLRVNKDLWNIAEQYIPTAVAIN